MSGADMIRAERVRQIWLEGYDSNHDDANGDDDLALAAIAYAMPKRCAHLTARIAYEEPLADAGACPIYDVEEHWPHQWRPQFYKPSGNRIRDPVKAGALICAEIDRLVRLGERHGAQDQA